MAAKQPRPNPTGVKIENQEYELGHSVSTQTPVAMPNAVGTTMTIPMALLERTVLHTRRFLSALTFKKDRPNQPIRTFSSGLQEVFAFVFRSGKCVVFIVYRALLFADLSGTEFLKIHPRKTE